METKQSNETLPAVEKKGTVVEMALADTSQFVTFYYDKHFFGLPIDDVIEINRTLDVTPVPMAPEYVSGVVNLRGQILTAINLAARIGLFHDPAEQKEYNNVIMGNREEPVSLLVERIGDVMSIPTEKIEPPPDMIEGINLKYVDQVCKLDNKLLIILNSKALESAEENKNKNN
ncbi:MAG: chemotaxis protein CheW [Thermodesulfobacteria bacterium]|nr:chemotaxis protein CheW [Thermodesulfobacteriota bacterium]